MEDLYIKMRDGAEFQNFLRRIKPFGIEFTEDEDNGIFLKDGARWSIAKRMLYRYSGIARIWKNVGKGKDAHEDFLPMSDEEFYNGYIKTMLYTSFKL